MAGFKMDEWPTCACGCGEPVRAAQKHAPSRAVVKGQPQKYVVGHQHKGKPDYTIEDCGYETACWVWRNAGGVGYGDGNGKRQNRQRAPDALRADARPNRSTSRNRPSMQEPQMCESRSPRACNAPGERLARCHMQTGVEDMSEKWTMDGYVDVAERIRQFYERFPDGRLTTGVPPVFVSIDGKSFIWYNARAYRTPDDPLPGSGWAAEPVPGPTPYTKDSELMNAETAAWGRAIVACGFETKKIASSQEVQARRGTTEKPVSVENMTAAPQTFAELTEAFHKLLVDDFWLAEATEAKVPGKPRESLTRGDKAKVLQMLQTAYLRLLEHPQLSEGLADLPPSRAVVREVFASVLDGVELGGPPWRIASYDQSLENGRLDKDEEFETVDVEADRIAEEAITGA